MLKDDQVGFYREHGYLLLPSILNREYLTQLTTVTDEFVAGAKGLTHENEVYDLEDDHAPEHPHVRRLKDPDQRHAVYRNILCFPAVVSVLS